MSFDITTIKECRVDYKNTVGVNMRTVKYEIKI